VDLACCFTIDAHAHPLCMPAHGPGAWQAGAPGAGRCRQGPARSPGRSAYRAPSRRGRDIRVPGDPHPRHPLPGQALPNSTATSPLAITAIYVTIAADTVGTASLGIRPVCHLTRTLTTFVPPSALKTEMNKPWYVYLGVNRGAGLNRASRLPTAAAASAVPPRTAISVKRHSGSITLPSMTGNHGSLRHL
jgi:hypothetical protein